MQLKKKKKVPSSTKSDLKTPKTLYQRSEVLCCQNYNSNDAAFFKQESHLSNTWKGVPTMRCLFAYLQGLNIYEWEIVSTGLSDKILW